MNIELISKDDLKQLKTELLLEIGHLLNSNSPTKEYLTGNEVKELLGISTGTLQNWRIRGKLIYSKIDGKIYYKYDDIKELLDRNRINSLSKTK